MAYVMNIIIVDTYIYINMCVCVCVHVLRNGGNNIENRRMKFRGERDIIEYDGRMV